MDRTFVLQPAWNALQRNVGRYGGGVIVLAPVGPLIAAIITLSLLVNPPWGLDGGDLILVSLAFGFGGWAVLAIVGAGRATVRTANSRVYHDLANAVSWLDSTLARIDRPDTPAIADEVDRLRAEVYEVRAILRVYPMYDLPASRRPSPQTVGVEASAFKGEVHWLLGTAYNELYRRIHLIEADLLLLCPSEELLSFAVEDYFRLADSQVNRHELWQYQIERAIAMLGEDPREHFHRPVPGRITVPLAGATVDVAGLTGARFLLREVRTAVDEFRDSSFEGLVRLRGRTTWTLFAASLTVYISLITAALCGVDSKLLVGAGAFFITGVLVGLLNRMLTEQQLASDIEDYGLSTVRLFQTIVISGIAAVLGVVVATYGVYAVDQASVVPAVPDTARPNTPTLVTAPPVTPAATVTATATATPTSPGGDATAGQRGETQAPALSEIFDLGRYPVLLLVAAAFAVTPGLVLRRLEASSTSLKQEIKSIEPGSRSST
jgi:hypothetical protein